MKKVFVAISTIVATLAFPAHAQTFPTKPIKLIVPYSPGGLPDTVARLVAQRLTESLGQSVVVENKSGGNGAVAAVALATAPADGHTLIVTDASMLTINQLTTKKLAYDAKKDFMPVSLIASAPLFLAVHPKVQAETFDDFIALAKSKPGVLNYGSSGIGSAHHLTAEAMKAALGISMTHVPFRGSSQSVPALIGGQVDMVFSAYPSLAGFVKAGQAKLLATNSAKRSPLAPNVPAIAERVPGFDFAVIVIALAPTGTPPAIVQKLSAEFAKVLKQQALIDQFTVAGIEAIGGSPEVLAAAIQEEATRMAAAAKEAKLQAE